MNRRKTISKTVRAMVYNKYNGHCAYCGCKLEYKDMQVDHIDSVYRAELKNKEADESLDNYMPSCRQCNFYKSTLTLEEFRERVEKTLMRNLQKTFQYRLALKYGLIKEDIKPISFYFEKRGGKEWD